jgi:hypothetical protein
VDRPPEPPTDGDWTFRFEPWLHDVAPALHDAQQGWLAAIDSLMALEALPHARAGYEAAAERETEID